MARYRIEFMQEEWSEYVDGDAVDNLHDMFDALIDLVYVALGTAYLHGFDFDEGWARVHAANMKKVRAETDEQSKRGTSYDVVKPDGWEPPDLSDLV
jgi:predicted HAD superfamily Cof-like phosphohydrolase